MEWKDAVRLAKEGREEGYNYLYRQTCQKSYYVALKHVKQEEAARDVLQDAYIKAFQNLEQLQDADKFEPWFSKIVVSKALDELKKRKVILFSQMETDEESLSAEELIFEERIEVQPEISLEQKETGRLVQEMIGALSDEQRLCILMYYMEEMPVKDMAETLGVSENTVKSRLHYGRKNIKEKVLELERKGTKLYSLAPFPFFLHLLFADEKNARPVRLPINSILKGSVEEAVKAESVGGLLVQAGGKAAGLVVKKVIIGVAATLAVGGASVYGYTVYQDSRTETVGADAPVDELVGPEKEDAEAEMQGTDESLDSSDIVDAEGVADSEGTTDSEGEVTPDEETQDDAGTLPDAAESQPESEEALPQYTYTELEQVMYAKTSVNVRDLPSADGAKLGGLSKAQEVRVTGQCVETSWYRIEYDGDVGYVSNNYLVTEKPAEEVAQVPEAPQGSGTYTNDWGQTYHMTLQDVKDASAYTFEQVFTTAEDNHVYYCWVISHIRDVEGYSKDGLLSAAEDILRSRGYTSFSGKLDYVEKYDNGNWEVVVHHVYGA